MANTSTHSDLTVGSLVAALRQRLPFIVWTTGTLLVLAGLYCLFSTPHYKATSLVEVQRSSNDLLDMGKTLASPSNEIGDALNASLDIQTQIEILQSEALAIKVIQDQNLEASHDFEQHWSPVGAVLGLFSHKGVDDAPSASFEDSPNRRSWATAMFSKNLTVKPVPGTRLIEISFKSADPRLSAKVVNDLTQLLIGFGLNARNQETNASSQGLVKQLADLKKQAQDLQAKVVESQRSTGIYSLGEDAQGRDQVYSSTLDQLQQATTALSTATSSRIVKGALYDTIRGGDPEMISSLAGAGVSGAISSVQNSMDLLQTLRGQQAAAAATLAQDSSKFGPDYPKLVDERSNLASLDKAVSDEIRRIGERAKNDYEASAATEGKLKGIYDARKAQAEKLNDRAIEYGILKQEADNARNLYEDLSKRMGEAKLITNLKSSNISIIDVARAPAKPTLSPLLYLGGALLLGLFLGASGALFLDIIDPTVRSYGVIEEALGVSLFGILPSFTGTNVQRMIPSPLRGLLARIQHDHKGQAPIVVLDTPGIAFSNAMRALRFSLLSSREGFSPQVIVVTSSVTGEGKTTVAANLAVLLAKADKTVLYVDADMYRPHVGHSFEASQGSSTGLSQVLSSDQPAFQSSPVTEVGGLQVLPRGPLVTNPDDLIASETMQNCLAQWRQQFDHIVIDTSSVLEMLDPLILAQSADMTLLVARYGSTPKKSLERSFHTLASSTDTRIAVVLNDVDRHSVNFRDYFGFSTSQL